MKRIATLLICLAVMSPIGVYGHDESEPFGEQFQEEIAFSIEEWETEPLDEIEYLEFSEPDTTEGQPIMGSFENEALAVVPVTGIDMNEAGGMVHVGTESVLIRASVLPSNATNKKINWTSSNESVATVEATDEGGRLVCLFPGETTITATSDDGGFSKSCDIIVYATEDGFRYWLGGFGGATIIWDPDLEIPETVAVPETIGGIPVREIANSAFVNRTTVKKVIIPEGIVSIGDYAFRGCIALEKADLPEGLLLIGTAAFAKCENLDGISIPQGVMGIGPGAFAECSSISGRIVIPESVQVLGYSAFQDNLSLTGIDVEAGNQSYCSIDGVLFDKAKTSLMQYPAGKTDLSYQVPDGVEYIDGSSFSHSTNLEEIIFPESLKEIGTSAFFGCYNLKKANIPAGVEVCNPAAFSACFALTEITVDDRNERLTDIDGNLFSKDKSVMIQYAAGKTQDTYEIPSTVTRINDAALINCRNLKTVIIPTSVTFIGQSAFAGCNALKNIYYKGSETQWRQIFILTENSGLTNATIYFDSGEISEEDGFRFYISSGEARIREALESVQGDVVIPSSLGGCPVGAIDNGAFRSLGGITSVVIPESVTRIGEYAFYGCRDLRSVEILGQVKEIDQWTFAYCPKLVSVLLPDGLLTLAKGAFYDCEKLRDIEIPNSVTTIADRVFYDCVSLEDVVIPSGVAMIGEMAFARCKGFKEIDIPDGVRIIGVAAFFGCDGVAEINIPGTVFMISDNAFQDCTSLTEVVLPDGIEEIGIAAFGGCENLEKISIPKSVDTIGDEFVVDCGKLDEIIVDGNNLVYSGIDGCLFSKDGSKLYRYPAGKRNKEYTLPSSVKNIGNKAFAEAAVLEKVILPNGILSIGEAAFNNCTALAEINLPGSLTSISSYAFYGCRRLTSASIPDGITTLNHYTFTDCENLKTVTIGKKVQTLGGTAFDGCLKLTEIAVSEQNPTFSSVGGVLYNKNKTQLLLCPAGLRGSFVIPAGVTAVGQNAFYDCSGLISVIIPDGVSVIGEYAFTNCEELKTVRLGKGVAEIGEGAFALCDRMADVHYPGTESDWGAIEIADFNDGLEIATVHFGVAAPLIGDLNYDGNIGVKDIVAMRCHLADSTYLIDESVADVDGSGSLDIEDLKKLREIVCN